MRAPRRQILLALGVSVLAAGARAEDRAAPTPAQVELYGRAREAFAAGDHDTARALLESALRLGALNILELSLGRALFRLGRCAEAQEAYDAALAAPAVVDPPPDEVRRRVEAYVEDLRAECPVEVRVECEPGDAVVSVDGGEPGPCPVEPLRLVQGEHRLRATHAGRSVGRTLRLESFDERSIRLVVPVGAGSAPSAGHVPAARAPRRASTFGWVALGSGAALVVGGALVDGVWVASAIDDYHRALEDPGGRARERREDARLLQVAALAAYGVGLVAAAVGAVLLATGGAADGPRSRVELLPGGLRIAL